MVDEDGMSKDAALAEDVGVVVFGEEGSGTCGFVFFDDGCWLG